MILNTKYKTSLCRNYEMNGMCHMGPKCHFAHGKEEIRKPTDVLPADTPYINEPKGGLGTGATKSPKIRDKDHATLEQIQNALMNDSSVQNQITLQQLSYIMQNLEFLHKNNPYVANKLAVAKELLTVSNLNTVAELVQGILQMPNLSPETEHDHKIIVKEAKELSQMIYMRLAEQSLASLRVQKSMREDRGDQNWAGRPDRLDPANSAYRSKSGSNPPPQLGHAAYQSNSAFGFPGGYQKDPLQTGGYKPKPTGALPQPGPGFHPGMGVPTGERKKNVPGLPAGFLGNRAGRPK